MLSLYWVAFYGFTSQFYNFLFFAKCQGEAERWARLPVYLAIAGLSEGMKGEKERRREGESVEERNTGYLNALQTS